MFIRKLETFLTSKFNELSFLMTFKDSRVSSDISRSIVTRCVFPRPQLSAQKHWTVAESSGRDHEADLEFSLEPMARQTGQSPTAEASCPLQNSRRSFTVWLQSSRWSCSSGFEINMINGGLYSVCLDVCVTPREISPK